MMLTPILILDEVVRLALRLNVVINYVFGAAHALPVCPFHLYRCSCQLNAFDCYTYLFMCVICLRNYINYMSRRF